MKPYRKIFLLATLACLLCGCEKFLDKSPTMGLQDEDIYKNYASMSAYLDNCFLYLEQNLVSHYRGCVRQHVGTLSDEFASVDNTTLADFGNKGNWLKLWRDNGWEFGVNDPQPLRLSSNGVRVANNILKHIDMAKNLTEDERNKILGQAHFYRAWFYFQLIKRYGGMQKLDFPFIGDGTDQHIPRMTYKESHQWMIDDLNEACGMLPDNWDEKNTGRPTKAAALALRAMTQLYAASPLMQNSLTETVVKPYDQDAAKQAAKFGWETLQHLEANSAYRMMSEAEYSNIFYFPQNLATQPEFIWYNRRYMNDGGVDNHPKRTIRSFWLPSQAATGDIQNKDGDGASYNAPTQNMIDLFDRKGSDGVYYPIDDPRSGYDAVKYNDPFADRDPRLKNNIIVPAESFGVNAAGNPYLFPLWEGGVETQQMNSNVNIASRQMTGYICKKFLWPQALNFTNPAPGHNRWVMNKYITVYIRYSQVYLDFAEASFEGTGSATATVDGCGMTAAQAIDIVRNRVGMTALPADIVGDPTRFREALRRERAVELMFENHRWWDIRRWMAAHEMFSPQVQNPIRGMQATPNSMPVNASTTFTYTYRNLDKEVRSFAMRNYWYPFTIADASSVEGFTQNPYW